MYYTDGYTSTKSFTMHTCSEPVAGFTMSDSQVCSGSSVTYTNSSTYANSYAWSFPGGSPSTSTSANPTVTYSTPGTYSVELTVTNAVGSSTKTSQIEILTAPEASFTASTTTIIPSESIELGNSSLNATSYTWTLTGGTPSSSSEEKPVVTYDTPGSYTITLTATNDNCKDVETKSGLITVVDPYTIIDDFETDEGHFNQYPTYSGTTIGISAESTQERVTTTSYGGSGSLEVSLLDDTSISTDWVARLLSGLGSPDNNTPFANSGALTFWLKSSTAGDDAVVQIWVDDSDGLEASPGVSVANDGKWHQYSFDLDDFGGTTITTGNGVLDASEVTLDAIVLAQSNTSTTLVAYIDDVIHDLGGKGTYLKQSSDKVSDIDMMEEISEIMVYPNPTKGMFTINLNNTENQEYEISVMNTSGSLIKSAKAFTNQHEMDIQDLPVGMYFVNIRNNKINKTISILKQE
jgi:PKD repeat protein